MYMFNLGSEIPYSQRDEEHNLHAFRKFTFKMRQIASKTVNSASGEGWGGLHSDISSDDKLDKELRFLS